MKEIHSPLMRFRGKQALIASAKRSDCQDLRQTCAKQSVQVSKTKQYELGDDELVNYALELIEALGLSSRAAQATCRQVAAASLTKQLAIISDLEEALQEKGIPLPSADTDSPNVAEQCSTEENLDDNQSENQLEDIDTQWEELLARSELTEAQVTIMSRQYYALISAQSRLHMYMEFASYLRPLSDAQIEFRDKMKAIEAEESASSSPWTSHSAVANVEKENAEPWYKQPRILSISIFATLMLRFFLQ